MMRDYYQGYTQGQMNYGYNFPDMIQLFILLFLIVLFVDSVLLGFWLWKQLKKK